MLELMQILSMLCGLDYSGPDYKKCVDKSRECVEKQMKSVSLKDTKSYKEKKRIIFYKCYKEGEI